MSETAEAAAVAPTGGETTGGGDASTIVTSSSEAAAPESTRLPGQPGGEAAEPSTPNAYETRFSAFSDADGNFTDATRTYLEGQGMDSGRIDRIMRQGGLDNTFKALGHAQDLVEKRDGTREYIPDATNENEFNQWRDEKGIPRDPADPAKGYNFNSGLPEGENPIMGKESMQEVGQMLHSLNVPKEAAEALIAKVNSDLTSQVTNQTQEVTDDLRAREQKSYDDFKQKHGFEFEAKEAQLSQTAKAYGFDFDDPYDRAALMNPKVMDLMVDQAAMSRTTATTPEAASSAPGGTSPQHQIETIMKEHPNGAWRRDSTLAGRVEALAKQAEAQKRR